MKFGKMGGIFLGAASLSMVSGSTMHAQGKDYEPKSAIVKQEKAEKKADRPHYLEEVPSKEKLKKMKPLEKLVQAFLQSHRDYKNGKPNSTELIINGCAREKMDIHGSEIEVIFPYYLPEEDGSWTYAPDNKAVDKKKILADLKNTLEEGANIAYGQYLGVSPRTNEKIKRIYPKAKRDRFKIIKGTDLTYDDVFGILELQKKDFLLPGAKIYFAPPINVLAATSTSNNKIIYSPVARRFDEIWGGPYIIGHELVHNNPKLQGFPGALIRDLELQAFQINLSNKQNIVHNFLYHPYAKDVRRFAELYFGTGLEKMRKSLIKDATMAYTEIDEIEFAKAMTRLNGIANVLQHEFLTEATPEYLSFWPWWLMLNNHLKNPIAPMEITLAGNLEPALENYEEFLKNNGKAINNLISKVNKDYRMPQQGNYSFFGGLSSHPYRKSILSESILKGFDKKEAEVIYHLALQKTFLDREGRVNYAALSLKESVHSMSDLVNIFDNVEDKGNPTMKKKKELYRWFLDRIISAQKYAGFADIYGSRPSMQFAPQVFDPRVDLEKHYKHKPNYLKRAKPINIRHVEWLDVDKDGVFDFKIEHYNLVKGIGYKKDGTDYIAAYRKNEDKPCLIAYVPKTSKRPNMVLVDSEMKGKKGHGEFDEAKKIKEFKDIEKILEDINLGVFF